MQLSTFIIGAVLGLASTSLALPADPMFVPATDRSLALSEPGPDSSSGTVTTIVASIVGLPDMLTVNDLGTAFPGLITLTGTALAPLNNGLATFTFLTSVTNEITGTTVTQTANGVTQSLTFIFSTPFTCLTAFIDEFFPAASQGQNKFDNTVVIIFKSLP